MKLINAVTAMAIFFGSVQVVQAAQSFDVDMQVRNGMPDTVQLTSASWPLGDATPESFALVGGAGHIIGLSYEDETKGQATFSYSAPGGKSCLFTAGHDIKESFGWFKSDKTPYQWAEAKSQGSFVATCTAKVTSYDPGKGYKVKFWMK